MVLLRTSTHKDGVVVVVGTAQRKKILSHKMMSLAELLKKKEQ
jgi:hypothetical protein